MTITLDIQPNVKDELERQAASKGRALETYAAALLEGAVHLPASKLPVATNPEGIPRKSLVEVCAMVKGLTDDIDFTRNPSAGRIIELS